jgi:hypothetical protein
LPPLRLASVTSGVSSDGSTGHLGKIHPLRRFAGGDSREVLLNRHGMDDPSPVKVHVAVGPLRVSDAKSHTCADLEDREPTLASAGTHLFTLPIRQAPFQVWLSVTPGFASSQHSALDLDHPGVRASFNVR